MKGIKNVENSIGKKYGRWLVLEGAGSDSKYRSQVKVICDCGTIRLVRLSELTYGASTSCGCYNREIVSKTAKTHGQSKTALYRVWSGMKERCLNPNTLSYKHYGGRGIKLHHYWKIDFSMFLYWAIKNGWKKGLEIDRINNDGNYEPSNCRITTEFVNSRNKRSNINITIGNETKVLQDWCTLFGLKHNTISRRYKKGERGDILFRKSNRKTILTQ